MKVHAIVAALTLGLGAVAASAQNASQWDFDAGTLGSSYGPSTLSFWDRPKTGVPGSAEADTAFGSASSFGIGLIGGSDANVMRVPPYFGTQGILCNNASPHNGGGVYLNQYTLIFDIYVDNLTFSAGSGWLPFHNTNADHANDADAYSPCGRGRGIDGDYAGTVKSDAWHRVAMTFDLPDKVGPRFTKYVDGTVNGWQIRPEGNDGRWSM